MNPETLLLESLPALERITAFVCRQAALNPADAEDFGSWVKLKLIENDYAILRKFEGRSAISTYLAIVVKRLMLDYRNHQLGKWRPSAEARRLGELAIELETLIHRDRRGVDEAMALLEAKHPSMTRADIERTLGQLPQRAPRRREIALEDVAVEPAVPADAVERDLSARESEALARKTGDVLRDAIRTLPESDRLLLRMRFEAGMTVAEIARSLGGEASALYRRIYRHLDALRTRLEEAGIRSDEAIRVVDSRAALDFGLHRDASEEVSA